MNRQVKTDTWVTLMVFQLLDSLQGKNSLTLHKSIRLLEEIMYRQCPSEAQDSHVGNVHVCYSVQLDVSDSGQPYMFLCRTEPNAFLQFKTSNQRESVRKSVIPTGASWDPCLLGSVHWLISDQHLGLKWSNGIRRQAMISLQNERNSLMTDSWFIIQFSLANLVTSKASYCMPYMLSVSLQWLNILCGFRCLWLQMIQLCFIY